METAIAAPAQSTARATFEGVAARYDAWMEHPAYPGWVRRLEALARRHGLRGRTALDLGCGTGKSTEPLAELGYRVVACDESPGMLARCRARMGARARVVEADMRALPDLGRFDYVTCLNDVVNYVDADGLRATLRGVAASLRPGGVAVFDTSTLALYRALYAADDVRVRPDGVYAWKGTTPKDLAPGGVATTDLHAFVARPDGTYARELTHHLQHHHPEALVRAAIAAAGLELLGVHGQWDDGFPQDDLDPESHTKAVWVVRTL